MADDKTFRVDNFIIQNQAAIYSAKRPKAEQLSLDGFAPLPPFEFWATLACYSLLDPKKPAESVFTTTATLLETLGFARVANEALGGYDSYPSDAYQMVEQALHRLYSTPIYWRGFWHVRTGKAGRPKKRWVEYSGYIITEFEYVYRSDVISPIEAKESQRRDVNKTDIKGEFKPPIWKLTNGPKPIGVSFRLASKLVQGLTNEGENIGHTIMPFSIFELRPIFGPYPLATRLLMKVVRDVNRKPRIGIDKLIAAIKMEGRNRSRNQQTVLGYLDMIQASGVISELTYDQATGLVTYTKNADWFFPSGLLTTDEEDEE